MLRSRKEFLKNSEALFYSTYSKSRFEDLVTVADHQIESSHFYEVKNGAVNVKNFSDFIWSIQNRRKVIIENIHFDFTSIAANVQWPAVLLPIKLVYHRGVVHVAGLRESSKKVIIVALEPVGSYRLTNGMFGGNTVSGKFTAEMNKRFRVTENIDNKTYDIEIEFTRNTAHFVKSHHWHSTQYFEETAEGNQIMKLHCGFPGRPHLFTL